MTRLNGRLEFCVRALCVLLAVASLTACSSGANSAVGHSSTTPPPVPATSPVCGTGSLQIVGSTAFMPIAQDVADAYMSDCPGATIKVSDGDSAYGLTKVRDAVASGSSSAGSMIAMYDGLPSATETAGLSPYPVGVLIFSVVAHTGLIAASNITTDELRKIYVKPGVKGEVAVGRRAGSGSRKTFIANVLGLNPGPPDKGNCPVPTGSKFSFTSCTEDSTADLLTFVNRTPNAIGYAELSQPITDYTQVSVISIDNAAPTPDNVRNGSYKFWIVEHLYAAAQPTALTKDFLGYFSQDNKASDLPRDFIPCSDALKSLGAACVLARGCGQRSSRDVSV
jgi:phosphate transport system substrate-binding protein